MVGMVVAGYYSKHGRKRVCSTDKEAQDRSEVECWRSAVVVVARVWVRVCAAAVGRSDVQWIEPGLTVGRWVIAGYVGNTAEIGVV
jgi:anti-sigma-K factor RskA